MTRDARGITFTALVAIACITGAAPRAQAVVDAVSASFLMSAQAVDVGRVSWQITAPDDDTRVWESVSASIGIARLIRDETIRERSRMRLHQGTVQPLEYSYSRHGGKRERTARIEFDWRQGQAINALNGASSRLPLTPGVQDKLSYLLALMEAMKRGDPPAAMTVSDGAKVKVYHFKGQGTERLDTVLGQLDTVKVQRTVDGDARETLVWLAPSLDYFPVRMEHREDGQLVTFVLESAEGLRPR